MNSFGISTSFQKFVQVQRIFENFFRYSLRYPIKNFTRDLFRKTFKDSEIFFSDSSENFKKNTSRKPCMDCFRYSSMISFRNSSMNFFRSFSRGSFKNSSRVSSKKFSKVSCRIPLKNYFKNSFMDPTKISRHFSIEAFTKTKDSSRS